MLKCRFRRLKYLDMSRIDLIPEVIIACCILHNICIQNNDSIATDFNEIFDEELQYVADGHQNPNITILKREGMCKRDEIKNQL